MVERKKLHFSIEGEFVTNLARERFFMDNDLGSAISLLRSCLISNELSSDEQLMLCLQIINGDASIKGSSGSDDYGVEYREDIDEDPTQLSVISDFIRQMREERDALRAQLTDAVYKIGFLSSKLDNWKLESVNAEYYNETGEPLFPDMRIPSWMKAENQLDMGSSYGSMLESFIEQRTREKVKEEEGEEVCDYGWLEPDGAFHPVEWGQHAGWAAEWLKENRPFKEHPELYWKTDKDGHRRHMVNNDVLVYSLGWILLDNPWHGVARVTRDMSRNITNKQKEFLYTYFLDRGRREEANALYE